MTTLIVVARALVAVRPWSAVPAACVDPRMEGAQAPSRAAYRCITPPRTRLSRLGRRPSRRPTGRIHTPEGRAQTSASAFGSACVPSGGCPEKEHPGEIHRTGRASLALKPAVMCVQVTPACMAVRARSGRDFKPSLFGTATSRASELPRLTPELRDQLRTAIFAESGRASAGIPGSFRNAVASRAGQTPAGGPVSRSRGARPAGRELRREIVVGRPGRLVELSEPAARSLLAQGSRVQIVDQDRYRPGRYHALSSRGQGSVMTGCVRPAWLRQACGARRCPRNSCFALWDRHSRRPLSSSTSRRGSASRRSNPDGPHAGGWSGPTGKNRAAAVVPRRLRPARRPQGGSACPASTCPRSRIRLLEPEPVRRHIST